MSRVHDALRRAGQTSGAPGTGYMPPTGPPAGGNSAAMRSAGTAIPTGTTTMVEQRPALKGLLEKVVEIPFHPLADSLLIDPSRTHDAPSEEFRTLRTRLNHMQNQQGLHTLVVTSPSPAEGKSFAAANFAIAQSQLAGSMTLLADFDFRRPIVHNMFNVERSPGLTDYLLGKVPLHEAMRKVQGTNLVVMPAGESVVNPLELLNLREVAQLLQDLPTLFNWVVLDSPPLLFAADANLLSTISDGTLLVVRIGHTTIDSITRAMQSLSHDNVVGIVVNGARRGELYSKYTYYHTYYTPGEDKEAEEREAED